MIRAIIWDIGEVLWRIEDLNFHRKWETRLGLSEGELAELVFNNQTAQQAIIGKVTPQAVWETVGIELEISAEELETLRVEIWKDGVWDKELLSYVGSLRAKYKTGIISDGWLDSREAVGEWINAELFDVIMYSAEEGIKKPNPIIYERMLKRLGVRAEEAIMIDDWQESVEGAQQVGLMGIQYTEEVDVIAEIKRIMERIGTNEEFA
jgi:putative hydrolase of the HAD superfamily